ncbi:alpha/beta hydrolase [Streptomyces sp. NPDC089424]|uniref:alpha/beta hydrolase n=1 Tax=Streptomyces sp. NPDC089424 TaxID=3365917 RepID=UPI0037FFD6E1
MDGSGRQGVYEALKRDGYHVAVVQNPRLSPDGDVAATRQVIDAQRGPVILVGHSYGGVVVTEAGNQEKVTSLVYIAAFAPDKGESVNTLISDPPPGAAVPPILPPVDGFLHLDRDKFAEAFAGDLPRAQAEFLAGSQVPWGLDAAGGAVSTPAWRTKPSWYLVATDDRTIAQRAMAERIGARTVEAEGSHAIYVSQPAAVADLIRQAAGSCPKGQRHALPGLAPPEQAAVRAASHRPSRQRHALPVLEPTGQRVLNGSMSRPMGPRRAGSRGFVPPVHPQGAVGPPRRRGGDRRSGRRELALRHILAAREAGLHTTSARLDFVLLGADAPAAANDEEAELRFETTLSVEGRERRPFELARTHLYYGERLRRGRSAAQARGHLDTAAHAFTRLGATP